MNGSRIIFGGSGDLTIRTAGTFKVEVAGDLQLDYERAFHRCSPEFIEHVKGYRAAPQVTSGIPKGYKGGAEG